HLLGDPAIAAAKLGEPVVALVEPPQDRRLPLRADQADGDVDTALLRVPAHGAHLRVGTHMIVRTGATAAPDPAWTQDRYHYPQQRHRCVGHHHGRRAI